MQSRRYYLGDKTSQLTAHLNDALLRRSTRGVAIGCSHATAATSAQTSAGEGSHRHRTLGFKIR